MLGKTMKFNGYIPECVVILRGRKDSAFAPLTRNIQNMRIGSRLRSTSVQPRVISQPIAYIAKDDKTNREILDELSTWLVTEEPKKLEFKEEPGRVYYAVVEGGIEEIERFSRTRTGVINFLCLDPYGYGEEYAEELSKDYFSNGIEVQGNEKTPWKATFQLQEDASSYIIEIEDKSIILNYDFKAYNRVEIDYKTRSVRIDGVLRMKALSMQSEWSLLPTGWVNIKVTEDTYFTYIERYR